jgi:hypothetical protein
MENTIDLRRALRTLLVNSVKIILLHIIPVRERFSSSLVLIFYMIFANKLGSDYSA